MRTIFILTICLWVGFVHAQSEPQKEKHADSEAPTPHTNENPVHPPNLVTLTLTKSGNQQADNPDQEPAPKREEPWREFPNWVIPAFTVVLAVVAIIQALIYGAILTSTKAIERAYVKMSHLPPGLRIEQSNGRCGVTMQVKNFGHTPATVTGILLTYRILPSTEPLPDCPDYKGRNAQESPIGAFLVTGDEVSSPHSFPLDAQEMGEIQTGARKLWLYGYVDYIDQFKRPFRGGYVRVYQPGRDEWVHYPGREEFDKRSNLVFVTQPGYNYDRPR